MEKHDPHRQPPPWPPEGGTPAPLPTPWVTVGAIVACVVVFFGLAREGPNQTYEDLQKWGYVMAEDIWRGQWWGLVTSPFVHLAMWHAFFNLQAIWVLGAPLERAMGPLPYLALFVMSAVISSTMQIAFSGATGIGLSGVVYGLFGFLWRVWRAHGKFRDVIDERMVRAFFVWLLICVVITELGLLKVGNAAHASGLLFGIAAAECFVVRKRSAPALAALVGLVILSLVPLVWSPWSPDWQATKAADALKAGRYEEASERVEIALRKDPENELALRTQVGLCEAGKSGKPKFR